MRDPGEGASEFVPIEQQPLTRSTALGDLSPAGRGEIREPLAHAHRNHRLRRSLPRFRWDIPARFNIATACCDRHADGTGRLALIYVDEDGGATRTSFDEISEMSRRFANVLKADGLVRGDRVAVFLSQSLELPIAHLAAFRSGMVSVPLFALFGEDALEFRLSNSGAKAIVTDETGWEKLAKIRDRLPDLATYLCHRRRAPAGAKSFWRALKAASGGICRPSIPRPTIPR